jgi:hypothetical protein
VTFIGVVLYINAAITAAIGIALIFDNEREALTELTGRDADYLLGSAIVELGIAALLFLAASAIMAGTNWARLAVAVVVGIRLTVVAFWLVAHLGGVFNSSALIYTGIGIFVLWALYGNERSQEYFEG